AATLPQQKRTREPGSRSPSFPTEGRGRRAPLYQKQRTLSPKTRGDGQSFLPLSRPLHFHLSLGQQTPLTTSSSFRAITLPLGFLAPKTRSLRGVSCSLLKPPLLDGTHRQPPPYSSAAVSPPQHRQQATGHGLPHQHRRGRASLIGAD
ncbi:hypothetical protein H0E87_001857, partial [Populus deltoides]